MTNTPINPLNPTLLAPYVARTIIQPTPNIIQTPQTQQASQQLTQQPSKQLLQQNNVNNNNNNNNHNNNNTMNKKDNDNDSNILDKRLDEIRLPPNNNPFYQDERFNLNSNNNNNVVNIRNNHNHNKYVGKKRNFSKMNGNNKHNNSNGNNNNNDNNNDKNDKTHKHKKFETELKEKRQLYVYNIPSHVNTMTRLTSHFQQFGDIQHIQVHRDLNKAYVQFSSHGEALEALNYPDTILNEASIQTTWAHYNRRDFDRNAKNNNNINNHNNKKENGYSQK